MNLTVVTVFGVVFAIAMFSCLTLLSRFVRKKAIEEPVKQGLERGSPVAAFTDDLMRHRWVAIAVIAVLVGVAKSLGIYGGLGHPRLLLAGVIVAIFGARVLLRQRSGRGGTNPPEQDR